MQKRAALIGLLLIGMMLAATARAQSPIPYLQGPLDPSTLQLYFNTLIQSINAVLNPLLPNVPGGVNMISLIEGVTGSPAQIGLQSGADTNAGILINPNGSGNIILFGAADTGVLQLANASSFTPAVGLGLCPSIAPAGNTKLLGPNPTIQGFFTVQDWLSRNRYLPAC